MVTITRIFAFIGLFGIGIMGWGLFYLTNDDAWDYGFLCLYLIIGIIATITFAAGLLRGEEAADASGIWVLVISGLVLVFSLIASAASSWWIILAVYYSWVWIPGIASIATITHLGWLTKQYWSRRTTPQELPVSGNLG